MRKKVSFTILELLVCFLLLSLFSVFISSKGLDLIHQYEFNRSVNQVVEEIELTKSLSITYQAYMLFKIGNKEDGLVIERVCYELPKTKLDFFKPKKLKNIFLEPLSIEFIVTSDGIVANNRLTLISNKNKVELIIKDNNTIIN